MYLWRSKDTRHKDAHVARLKGLQRSHGCFSYPSTVSLHKKYNKTTKL